MAQQYVSFPPLNLKQPKNVFPSQFPNTELVAFHSALSLPTFMGLVSLGPMSQQYVSFTPLNLKHPKYVLPAQCPVTVLVSFPSALWLPKFKVSFPSAPWPNNMWVSLPSTLNTQNMYFPHPPQYPRAVLVSFPSALRLPKFMVLVSLNPVAQQYVSFPSLNLKHPNYVLPPPLNSQALYWFHFPQLRDSQNLWVSFPSAPCPNNYIMRVHLSLTSWNSSILPSASLHQQYAGFISLSLIGLKV